ncbi:MAG: transglutaminase-like cysteine peptidase [Pikeienuella sp.]
MFDRILVEKSGRALNWWRLFNKVELRPQSQVVQDCVEGDALCDWEGLRDLRETSGQAPHQVASALAATVSYRDDNTGHWQGPLTTLRQGGDCEDHAVLQMSALIAMGVAPETLLIVTLKPRKTKRFRHTVLAIREAAGWRFLDVGGEERTAGWILNRYTPMLAYAGDGAVYDFAPATGSSMIF